MHMCVRVLVCVCVCVCCDDGTLYMGRFYINMHVCTYKLTDSLCMITVTMPVLYIHTYIHAYIHTLINTYVYIQVDRRLVHDHHVSHGRPLPVEVTHNVRMVKCAACICVCVCVCTHTCVCIHMCVCVCVCVCT